MLLLDVGLANVERVPQQCVGVHDLEIELDLAFADARQIEQVIDQPRFQLDVAPNDLHRFAACFPAKAFRFPARRRRREQA